MKTIGLDLPPEIDNEVENAVKQLASAFAKVIAFNPDAVMSVTYSDDNSSIEISMRLTDE